MCLNLLLSNLIDCRCHLNCYSAYSFPSLSFSAMVFLISHYFAASISFFPNYPSRFLLYAVPSTLKINLSNPRRNPNVDSTSSFGISGDRVSINNDNAIFIIHHQCGMITLIGIILLIHRKTNMPFGKQWIHVDDRCR